MLTLCFSLFTDHHHPDHQATHRQARPFHRGRRRDRWDIKRNLPRHHRVRRRGARRGCVLTRRHEGRQELLRVRTAGEFLLIFFVRAIRLTAACVLFITDPVRGVWPPLRQRHLHQQKLRDDRDDRGVREAVG